MPSPDTGDRRDNLALIRTDLANERTLLAYQRTAFMLAGSGATLIKFFADSLGMFVLGWSLIAAGGAVSVIGLIRFRRLQKQLR
ncbi:MAG: DUF202 domain-containing protein [Planctomycetota bacterium]